jgi:hypothetical protein
VSDFVSDPHLTILCPTEGARLPFVVASDDQGPIITYDKAGVLQPCGGMDWQTAVGRLLGVDGRLAIESTTVVGCGKAADVDHVQCVDLSSPAPTKGPL